MPAPEFDKSLTHVVLFDALRLYRQHFRLFASIVVLPTFVGVFFLWMSRLAASHLIQSYGLTPLPTQRMLETMRTTHIVLELTLIQAAGFLGVWLSWSFAFMGVTVAVGKLLKGEEPEAEHCLNSARENPGRFLLPSVYLFLEIWFLAFFTGEFAFMAWSQLADHLQLKATSVPGIYVGFIEVALVAALTLPFLLGVPISVIDNKGVITAFKKSFQLTEGRSLVMLGLFLESEISSYLVAIFVGWLSFLWRDGYGAPVLQGSTRYIEVVVTAFLQPIAMIGFAWIYVSRKQELTASEAVHAKYAVSDSDAS